MGDWGASQDTDLPPLPGCAAGPPRGRWWSLQGGRRAELASRGLRARWAGWGRERSKQSRGQQGCPWKVCTFHGPRVGAGPGFAHLAPCAKWKHLLRNSAQLPAPHPAVRSSGASPGSLKPPSALASRGSARSVRPSPAISRGWCAETPAALPRLLNNPHTCAPVDAAPRGWAELLGAGAGAGRAAPADPGPAGSGREVLGALEAAAGSTALPEVLGGGPKSRP